jgi:hypothetical protein
MEGDDPRVASLPHPSLGASETLGRMFLSLANVLLPPEPPNNPMSRQADFCFQCVGKAHSIVIHQSIAEPIPTLVDHDSFNPRRPKRF